MKQHKPSAKADGNKATTLLNLSSFIAVHFLPVRRRAVNGLRKYYGNGVFLTHSKNIFVY